MGAKSVLNRWKLATAGLPSFWKWVIDRWTLTTQARFFPLAVQDLTMLG